MTINCAEVQWPSQIKVQLRLPQQLPKSFTYVFFHVSKNLDELDASWSELAEGHASSVRVFFYASRVRTTFRKGAEGGYTSRV